MPICVRNCIYMFRFLSQAVIIHGDYYPSHLDPQEGPFALLYSWGKHNRIFQHYESPRMLHILIYFRDGQNTNQCSMLIDPITNRTLLRSYHLTYAGCRLDFMHCTQVSGGSNAVGQYYRIYADIQQSLKIHFCVQRPVQSEKERELRLEGTRSTTSL